MIGRSGPPQRRELKWHGQSGNAHPRGLHFWNFSAVSSVVLSDATQESRSSYGYSDAKSAPSDSPSDSFLRTSTISLALESYLSHIYTLVFCSLRDMHVASSKHSIDKGRVSADRCCSTEDEVEKRRDNRRRRLGESFAYRRNELRGASDPKKGGGGVQRL